MMPSLRSLLYMAGLMIASACIGALGARAALAQRKPAAATDEKTESPDSAATEPRRNLNKIRSDSLLHRDKPLVEEQVELRGTFEKRRDLEIIRHYRWMAELDVIETTAEANGQQGLVERVESVRRSEKRRFWYWAQRFRLASRLTSTRGIP